MEANQLNIQKTVCFDAAFAWLMRHRHWQNSFAWGMYTFVYMCILLKETAVISDTVSFMLLNWFLIKARHLKVCLNVIYFLAVEILSVKSAPLVIAENCSLLIRPVSLYGNSCFSWRDQFHVLNLNSNGSTSTEY